MPPLTSKPTLVISTASHLLNTPILPGLGEPYVSHTIHAAERIVERKVLPTPKARTPFKIFMARQFAAEAALRANRKLEKRARGIEPFPGWDEDLARNWKLRIRAEEAFGAEMRERETYLAETREQRTREACACLAEGRRDSATEREREKSPAAMWMQSSAEMWREFRRRDRGC